MSYSFSLSATSKAEAVQKMTEQVDLVATNQPVHAADRDAAVATGQAFINMIGEPPAGKEIRLSMNGYLGWSNDDADKFTGASINLSVGIQNIST